MAGQDEWVKADEAVAILKPILAEYSARLRICERAHGGLIRARAEQYHQGKRVFHNMISRSNFGGRKAAKRLSKIGLRAIFLLGSSAAASS